MAAIESTTSPRSGRPRDRFALTGHSTAIDPRIDAARRDLADVRLASRVFAPHYAKPIRRFAGRTTPLLADPADPIARSQVLTGEPFDVLEITSTHLWGIAPTDGAVGLVDATAFVRDGMPSHVVCVRQVALHQTADPASRTIGTLFLGERVAAQPAGDMAEVDGGYVAADALSPLSEPCGDAAAIAVALLGTPALAGGRSGAGVDAAGLIALAVGVAGGRVPRFADLMATTGDAVAQDALRRGDVVVFADHAAIMIDGENAVHVGEGAVVRAPLAAITGHGEVVARRRPA